MKLNKNSNRLPEWLNAFTDMLAGKKESVANKNTAEINVQSLPTVSWKDETYHVDFTPQGAILYNDFGNSVQLIDNATSIEEVDDYLNTHAVVASAKEDEEITEVVEEEPMTVVKPEKDKKDEFWDELNKVAEDFEDAVKEEEPADKEKEKAVKKSSSDKSEIVANNDMDNNDAVTDETVESADTTAKISLNRLVGTKTAADEVEDTDSIANEENEEEADTKDPDNTDKEQQNTTDDTEEQQTQEEADREADELIGRSVMSAEKQAEQTIAIPVEEYKDLVKKAALASVQQYAHSTELHNYDLNCEEREVAHFDETAQNTAKVINKEHEMDLTKQSERAKLNADYAEKAIEESKDKPVKQTTVKTVMPSAGSPLLVDRDLDKKDMEEEEKVVAAKDEDKEDTNKDPEEVVTIDEDEMDDDIAPATEIVDSEEEIPVVEEVVEETDENDDETDDESDEETDDDESDDNEDMKVEYIEDEETKDNALSLSICPHCGQPTLMTNAIDGDYTVELVCDNCGEHYAVCLELAHIVPDKEK